MNKKKPILCFVTLCFMFIFASCKNPTSDSSISETDYKIGDTGPSGGTIFYIDEGNLYDWTYLEVAPQGWKYPSPDDPNAPWSESLAATNEVGTSRDIDSGKANTIKIVNYEIYNTEDPADHCYNYGVGNFVDWWLPSQDEASKIFSNLSREKLVEIGMAYSDDSLVKYYWTSTESSASHAWYYTKGSTNTYGIGTTKTDSTHGFYRPIHGF